MSHVTAAEPLRILVTGSRDDLEGRCPKKLEGSERALEWRELPVLRFERLPVEKTIVEGVVTEAVDWILFTSHRAVRFWTELLLENELEMPLETQVACIGEQTAEAASADGYTPDFYPTEPGTEKFLEEFESLLSNNSVKPKIFIPMAEGGRQTIQKRLAELGCEVSVVPLYRTLPDEDLKGRITPEELARIEVFLFTSPSSVDAFTRVFEIPVKATLVAIGKFTGDHLAKKGHGKARVLPEGDFNRIGEIL